MLSHVMYRAMPCRASLCVLPEGLVHADVVGITASAGVVLRMLTHAETAVAR